MTLIRFCVCTYGNIAVSAYQDGVGALFPFISGEAFGDACFLMSEANKSSRLFLYLLTCRLRGLIGDILEP